MPARLFMAAFCAALVLANASDGAADEAWTLNQDGKLCYLARNAGEQSILVWHMRIPDKPDSGIVELSFRSPALAPALAQKDDFVWLFFEPEGEISGKQTPVDSGYVSTAVMSHSLQSQIDTIGIATKVAVKTKNATDNFDLSGLAAALPSLLECGRTSAQ